MKITEDFCDVFVKKIRCKKVDVKMVQILIHNCKYVYMRDY